jgi:hypothetical protein
MWNPIRSLGQSMATSGSNCDKGYLDELFMISTVFSSLKSIF